MNRLASVLVALIAIQASDMASVGTAVTTVAKPPQRVLVLYSDERLLPANIAIDEAIRATFDAGTSNRVEFYSEFLDRTRFPGQAQEQRQRDFFRDKYHERPPHLVVAVSGAALAFAVKYRAEIFPSAPMVYCSAPGDSPPPELRDAAVGHVPVPNCAAPTLELALRLQPDTRLVAVVSGSSPRDVELAGGLRSELPTFEKRVAFAWLTNRSLSQLRTDLSRLPEHSIVLYHTMFEDADGKTFAPRLALAEFAPASRSPIYGYYDTYLGYGIVGGPMVTFEAIGRKTGQLAIRILAGEDAQSAARAESYQPVPMFDWRELRRWNISPERLPPGSVVRFRPHTLWQDHKDYVIGGLVIFIAQAATIAALLVQLARRRRAEAAVRESEKRMALAADAARLGMWVWDVPQNRLWVSARGKQLFGYAPDAALTLEMLQARVHPEDRAIREQAVQRALADTAPYDLQHRLLLPDATVRWIATCGHVEFDSTGKPVRMLGTSIDITERKQSEQEIVQQRGELTHLSRVNMLGELAGSLAHELNQPLTAILSNAQAAQRFLLHDQPDLGEMRDILADIVAQDKRASEVIHRLRPLLKKGEVERQPLDLNGVIQEVLKLVRSDLVNHRVTLQTDLAPNLPVLHGDRVQLQQVLLNLVINACDAMSGVAEDHRTLLIRTGLDGAESVRISVADCGAGIDPGKLEQVFEPFYTTKPHGLGLGLSVCRTIVAAHGGKLWAENRTVSGAVFHLELPVEGKETVITDH